MLLIYIDSPASPRLSYVLDFVFKESFQIDYEWTIDKEAFLASEKAKLVYAKENIDNQKLFIKKHDFIDETGINIPERLNINRWKKNAILFYNQPGKKVPFDIFSAIFFLISRIEEYHQEDNLDAHQRFNPDKSIAKTYGFLQIPVVDIWLFEFKKVIESLTDLKWDLAASEVEISFDIDMLYQFKEQAKGNLLKRQFKYLITAQFQKYQQLNQVIKGKTKDPYDIWEELLVDFNHKPKAFILLSEGHQYDTNNSLEHIDYPAWFKKHAEQLDFYTHPSYRGHEDATAWEKEINIIENSLDKKVTKSRFHFIKYQFPADYKRLISLGIKDDYSMAYGGVIAYRASTARSFYWFDVKKNESTDLRIHPFVFMDSAAFYHEKWTAEEAFQYLQKHLFLLMGLHAPITIVFHNYLLGAQQDWKAMFFRFVELLKKNELDF